MIEVGRGIGICSDPMAVSFDKIHFNTMKDLTDQGLDKTYRVWLKKNQGKNPFFQTSFLSYVLGLVSLPLKWWTEAQRMLFDSPPEDASWCETLTLNQDQPLWVQDVQWI